MPADFALRLSGVDYVIRLHDRTFRAYRGSIDHPAATITPAIDAPERVA